MAKALETLLVEDCRLDENIITKMLASSENPHVHVSVCQTLQTAFQFLSEHPGDLVFLDLTLPDSYGLDTYINLKSQSPDIPVIILTSMENDTASIKAIQHGAQDYLIKKDITPSLLVRSMRYAVERFRLVQELKELSLKDDLTGLLNRRGFQLLADQLLKTAQRAQRKTFLIFSDLDGLKAINDLYGHEEGDRALCWMAQVLVNALRDSDVIARWGGDEFVAIGLLEEIDRAPALSNRLKTALEEMNATCDLPFSVSFSIGFAFSIPERPSSLDAMLDAADAQMYEDKKWKKRQQFLRSESL